MNYFKFFIVALGLSVVITCTLFTIWDMTTALHNNGKVCSDYNYYNENISELVITIIGLICFFIVCGVAGKSLLEYI